MQIEIRRRGLDVSEELRMFVADRLQSALGRFAHEISMVRVFLRDVNGPRGGPANHCRVVIERYPWFPVVVTGAAVDIRAAITRTANRAGFALQRGIKRRTTRRRRARSLASSAA